ncbi:uncharacterized protein F4822DRAFT_385809 [Hypoxylon trugodes]|uniref:uncharacterized protein n=1 Tax=Hypoxylon trugodes TaxID=326681 RepID=UPI0021A1A0FE|nr:uncharacterized protein F4822DRAFT_385809 [Hypoxylon trugodes]KAI1393779.1 hypothetical protein F4822DRAFT_385809 [Hypoxylon trugodes]
MLTCKACIRKACYPFISQSLRPNRILANSLPAYASFESHQRRQYATSTTTVTAPKKRIRQNGASNPEKLSPSERAARKQLQYLKDPLHIANHVKKILEKDDFEEAIAITRMASKDTKVAVSWNYLIDYQLRHDKIHAAIKLYNEMKKRAQFPTAATYTTIFRGCARSSHPKLAVSEVVRIYTSMLANPRLKPNTIHMNAALQVCARAVDIDALFGIVQTANDGTRLPDSQTYTTILIALRTYLVNQRDSAEFAGTNAEVENDQKQMISRAKTIWEEVISKWKDGSLVIDESLVCAMGRVLLMGDIHDAQEVETLIEQTMAIPQDRRTANKWKMEKEAAALAALPKEEKATSLHNEVKESTTSVNEGVAPKISKEALRIAKPDANTTLVTPIENHKTKVTKASVSGYVKPGNNSLSMILSSLEMTRRTSKTERYWNYFTETYNVVPDSENWYRLLLAFRRGKNSGKAVTYLREMPNEFKVAKSFRAAMWTCLRDNLNTFAFIHATDVLEMMMARPDYSDLNTLNVYLRVAYASKRTIEDQTDGESANEAFDKQLHAALDKLWKPYMLLARSYENHGPKSKTQRDLIAFVQKLMSACDRLLHRGALDPHTTAQIMSRRNSLGRVVSKHYEQMKMIDPSFKPEKDADTGLEDEADHDLHSSRQIHRQRFREDKEDYEEKFDEMR